MYKTKVFIHSERANNNVGDTVSTEGVPDFLPIRFTERTFVLDSAPNIYKEFCVCLRIDTVYFLLL